MNYILIHTIYAINYILIVGNLVSIWVLSKKEFRETFHKLLICLAVVDISFIICALITCIIRYLVLFMIGEAIDHASSSSVDSRPVSDV